MWDKIREMTPEQRDEWINILSPARGIDVDFKGVHVLDVDVLEALKNAK